MLPQNRKTKHFKLKPILKWLGFFVFFLTIAIGLWLSLSWVSFIVIPLLILVLLISFSYENNTSIPFLSPWLNQQYFKTKFKISELEKYIYLLTVIKDHPEKFEGAMKLKRKKILARRELGHYAKLVHEDNEPSVRRVMAKIFIHKTYLKLL
jgi:hypothetical protein